MTDATGEARKLRVFVSYAREDGDFVEELVASLQACGFEAYVDQKDIAPGEGFAKRIEGLIQSADTIVFALSPFSLDSEWCGREVDQTVALSKRMFPILLRDVDRSKEPERLAALQEIDFSKPKSFGKGLRLLVEALNAGLHWVREHTRLGDLARAGSIRAPAPPICCMATRSTRRKRGSPGHPKALPRRPRISASTLQPAASPSAPARNTNASRSRTSRPRRRIPNGCRHVSSTYFGA